jgi:FAD synthase
MVFANDLYIGSVPVDNAKWLKFTLDTTGAFQGVYDIGVGETASGFQLILDWNSPFRGQEIELPYVIKMRDLDLEQRVLIPLILH